MFSEFWLSNALSKTHTFSPCHAFSIFRMPFISHLIGLSKLYSSMSRRATYILPI
jgi:hypothetical protein